MAVIPEDNPYIIPPLKPDEYNELLSEYETYLEWSYKNLDARQRELTGRVIAKLREAEQTHVCVDEQEL